MHTTTTTQATFDLPAEAFRAMGDPVRLRALRFLLDQDGTCCAIPGRVCACDLVAHLGLAQPTVSHHMAILLRAGLVAGEKHGRWMYYSVRSDRFEGLAGWLNAIATVAARPQRAAA